jgi:hypothetical protein
MDDVPRPREDSEPRARRQGADAAAGNRHRRIGIYGFVGGQISVGVADVMNGG